MKHTRGFTLIELMVTIAVMAITLTLGTHSFRSMLERNQISTHANDFIVAINVTRSEAIKRNARVTMCTSVDGAACTTSGEWEKGWLIFVDRNSNGTYDGLDQIIRVGHGFKTDDTLRALTAIIPSYISYSSNGTSRLASGAVQSGVLALCNGGVVDAQTRAVTISQTGRARLNLASEVGVSSCSA